MSTEVFDFSRLPQLQQQRLARPWSRRPASFGFSVFLAVVLPALVVIAAFLYTDIPGALILVVGYLPLQLLAAALAAIATRGKRGVLDSFIIVMALGSTVFSFVVLISVIVSLIVRGAKALSVSFITENNVYISASTPLGYGGVGHAIIGTMMIVLIASLIAVPIGIATAVYITEVRGRAVPYVRFFVQAMSGVPSVVAGLFILTVFIVTGVLQQSAFAGALAYSILMLPTVARTAEEVLRLVPEDLRTGALALGSTRARTVLKVVLPAAKTGIITAIILGVARVIGETAPLLLTSLKADPTVLNPFNSPTSSLPVYIFDYVAVPYPDAVSRAWGAALVLMFLVLILFTIARILGRNRIGR